MKELKELREILCSVDKVREDVSEKWGTVKVTDTYELLKEESPIQERHIRMYCDKKGYPFAIGGNGKILGNRNEQGSYVEIKLDNSEDLEQQSPETLQAIIDFLKGV